MVFIGQMAPSVDNVCYVVCGRQSPTAVLTHDKREILVVVVCVVCQDIEYHATEYLNAVRFWKTELAANYQQLFVAISLGTNGSQCLGMKFGVAITVEPFGQKMIAAIYWVQFRSHHCYAGSLCHFIIGHFQLGRRILRISKFQNTIVIVVKTRYLTAAYLSRDAVDSNDGFGLTATSRCAYCQQRLHCY